MDCINCGSIDVEIVERDNDDNPIYHCEDCEYEWKENEQQI